MGNTTSCCVSSSPKLRRNHARLETYRTDTDISREDTGCNLQHISDREAVDGTFVARCSSPPPPGPPFPLGPAPVCELNTSAAPYIAGGGKPVCLHVPCPSVLQVLHCLTQSLMQTPRCVGGRKGVNALV